MKKLLALVLVAVMAFSCLVLASCGDKKEETSASSENSIVASADESKADESVASTDESASSADVSKEDDESATSEDATSEDAPVEIPEDVKATASYKYFSSIDLTKGFTFKTDLMGAKVSMSVLGENVYMETSIEMEGFSQSAKVIVKDGKAYMLDDAKKTYTVSEATGDELLIPVDEFSVEAIFGDLTFVSTTTEELEGVTFTVDNFKTSEGTDAKIYMDAEGKVVMMGNAEMMVPFELTNTIPEGIFDIPADYTEVYAENHEDVKTTAAYKFFESVDFTKGFGIITNVDGSKVSAYFLGDNLCINAPVEIGGKFLAMDGKFYLINDEEKAYAVFEENILGETVDSTDYTAEAIFEDLKFVSTSIEEIEGVTYTVETFIDKKTNIEKKYYIDSKGVVEIIQDGDTIIDFELGVPEGIFDIPADYTEAPAAQ